jgi:hypothetical protein
MRGKCIQYCGQHDDVALNVLDTTFPERCASGEEGMRHWFDARDRAPTGLEVGQIGSNMGERCASRRRRSRQAVDTPSGSARECSGYGSAGRAGRSDDKCDPVSHRKQSRFLDPSLEPARNAPVHAQAQTS